MHGRDAGWSIAPLPVETHASPGAQSFRQSKQRVCFYFTSCPGDLTLQSLLLRREEGYHTNTHLQFAISFRDPRAQLSGMYHSVRDLGSPPFQALRSMVLKYTCPYVCTGNNAPAQPSFHWFSLILIVTFYNRKDLFPCFNTWVRWGLQRLTPSQVPPFRLGVRSLSLSFIPPIQCPFLIYHNFQRTTTLVYFLLFLDFIAVLALASHYLFECLFPSRA